MNINVWILIIAVAFTVLFDVEEKLSWRSLLISYLVSIIIGFILPTVHLKNWAYLAFEISEILLFWLGYTFLRKRINKVIAILVAVVISLTITILLFCLAGVIYNL